MSEKNDSFDSYELRRVIFFGAIASGSLIFSVVGLLFLSSHISSHPGSSSDTLGEMMDYIEFFLFAFATYFAAAIVVLRTRAYFERFGPSWLFVSVVGSIGFSVAVVLTTSMRAVENGPAGSHGQPSLLGFWGIPVAIVVLAAVCSLITLPGSALASAIVYPPKRPSTLQR